jgi:hypothetical protein
MEPVSRRGLLRHADHKSDGRLAPNNAHNCPSRVVFCLVHVAPGSGSGVKRSASDHRLFIANERESVGNARFRTGRLGAEERWATGECRHRAPVTENGLLRIRWLWVRAHPPYVRGVCRGWRLSGLSAGMFGRIEKQNFANGTSRSAGRNLGYSATQLGSRFSQQRRPRPAETLQAIASGRRNLTWSASSTSIRTCR